MKEDSLYFGVFLKVVYNCIWKMTHLCIKLRKLKDFFNLPFSIPLWYNKLCVHKRMKRDGGMLHEDKCSYCLSR